VYSHDPGQLDTLLPAAGFTLIEQAALVCNFTSSVTAAAEPHPGMSEPLNATEDIRAAATLLAEEGDVAGLWTHDVAELQRDIGALLQGGNSAALLGIRIDATIAATGLVQVVDATGCAWLRGAATALGHRRRGLFTQLVIDRARFAAARNANLLAVEASKHSRSPLLRVGFGEIADVHTYEWMPTGGPVAPAGAHPNRP
jgi:hypothetical protein